MKTQIENGNNSTLNINFLYKKYYSEVLNYVKYRINGNLEIAEEITQDTFIKANEHLTGYNSKIAKLNTWLYTIANRKVIDYYRANNKSKNVLSVDNYTDENGRETFQIISENYNTETIESNEVNEAIEKAMNTLNDREKEIAEFYFLYNKQYIEISDLLDIPMGTVKGTINRIRGKLQSKLKNTYASL